MSHRARAKSDLELPKENCQARVPVNSAFCRCPRRPPALLRPHPWPSCEACLTRDQRDLFDHGPVSTHTAKVHTAADGNVRCLPREWGSAHDHLLSPSTRSMTTRDVDASPLGGTSPSGKARGMSCPAPGIGHRLGGNAPLLGLQPRRTRQSLVIELDACSPRGPSAYFNAVAAGRTRTAIVSSNAKTERAQGGRRGQPVEVRVDHQVAEAAGQAALPARAGTRSLRRRGCLRPRGDRGSSSRTPRPGWPPASR